MGWAMAGRGLVSRLAIGWAWTCKWAGLGWAWTCGLGWAWTCGLGWAGRGLVGWAGLGVDLWAGLGWAGKWFELFFVSS